MVMKFQDFDIFENFGTFLYTWSAHACRMVSVKLFLNVWSTVGSHRLSSNLISADLLCNAHFSQIMFHGLCGVVHHTCMNIGYLKSHKTLLLEKFLEMRSNIVRGIVCRA